MIRNKIKEKILSREKLAKDAETFKALGSVIRLRIILELKRNPCNVNQIYQKLQLRQSTVSQHLKTLKFSGIVVGIKKGNTVCYCLSNRIAERTVELVSEYFLPESIKLCSYADV